MNKSIAYISRRLFFYLLAGFMAISLNFLIPRLMPGDAASIMFAQFKGRMPIENLQALKQTFGFPEAEPFIDLNDNNSWIQMRNIPIGIRMGYMTRSHLLYRIILFISINYLGGIWEFLYHIFLNRLRVLSCQVYIGHCSLLVYH